MDRNFFHDLKTCIIHIDLLRKIAWPVKSFYYEGDAWFQREDLSRVLLFVRKTSEMRRWIPIFAVGWVTEPPSDFRDIEDATEFLSKLVWAQALGGKEVDLFDENDPIDHSEYYALRHFGVEAQFPEGAGFLQSDDINEYQEWMAELRVEHNQPLPTQGPVYYGNSGPAPFFPSP